MKIITESDLKFVTDLVTIQEQLLAETHAEC